jgi:nucleotide-binding universal stress UspA family protein
MFQKILVAQDGSHGSERVLPVALELATHDGAKLVLAHVDEQTTGKGGGSLNATDTDLQTLLAKRAEELSGEGIETSFEVRCVILGGPAHALVAIADEVGADLIVAGTRGHSSVGGLVLGSVAQRLLHLAHQPVLIVPESARVGAYEQSARAVAVPA